MPRENNQINIFGYLMPNFAERRIDQSLNAIAYGCDSQLPWRYYR
jgi:hypothetical protein